MKVTPMIFNGEMVRAILDGRKTQTRRVLRLPKGCIWVYDDSGTNGMWTDSNLDHGIWHAEEIACPYGQPGDLLYVRETWQSLGIHEPLSPKEIPVGSKIQYPASYDGWVSKQRPSIHMPRWASRITLEITGVRVERLQDISEQDASAEGCDNSRSDAAQNVGWYEKPRRAFQRLWDSIYGTWHANPWVWVIEFKPHLVNVDEFLKG